MEGQNLKAYYQLGLNGETQEFKPIAIQSLPKELDSSKLIYLVSRVFTRGSRKHWECVKEGSVQPCGVYCQGLFNSKEIEDYK